MNRNVSPLSAHVRPDADPAAQAPERAPRRQGRAVCKARGLQQRPRVRRQQDTQARIPRPRMRSRRARIRSCRSAACSRTRRSRSRGRRRASRDEMRARAGALGQLRRSGVRPGRQHPAPRMMGADVRLCPTASTSASAAAGKKRWRACGRRAASYPIPAGCSEHPLGGTGFVGFAEEVRAQEAQLGFKFDYIVVVLGHGQHAGGDGRRLRGRRARRPRSASTRRPRPSARMNRSRASRGTPPNSSISAGRSPPRTWCSTRATPAPNTGCRTTARSRRFACVRG